MNATANYGAPGVAATANIPSARDDFSTWNDGSFVRLFGGEGLNPSGADPNAPAWNDHEPWRLHLMDDIGYHSSRAGSTMSLPRFKH